MIPPTRAAATNTYSGFSFRKNSSVSACRVKSSSFDVRNSRFRKPSASRRRTTADPTMPRCPATNILLVFSKLMVFKIKGCSFRLEVQAALPVNDPPQSGFEFDKIRLFKFTLGARKIQADLFGRAGHLLLRGGKNDRCPGQAA